MGRERADYMREYRRRRAAEPTVNAAVNIAELEAEVARLKRELAARPAREFGTFNSRPFTPVPKKR